MDNLTDQEKSVLLAKAMGLNVQVSSGLIEFRNPVEFTYDLYSPANMALAWRVLNWAYEAREIDDQGRSMTFYAWWRSQAIFVHGPAAAQRLWLDKILELAIEAGIVELVNEDGKAPDNGS